MNKELLYQKILPRLVRLGDGKPAGLESLILLLSAKLQQLLTEFSELCALTEDKAF